MGATDLSTKFTGTHYGDFESVYSYNNLGPCVDIFAPGEDSLHTLSSTPVGLPQPVCSKYWAVSGQAPQYWARCVHRACGFASSSWLSAPKVFEVLCCKSAPDSHWLRLAHSTWRSGAGVDIFGACGGAGETETDKAFLHGQEEACAQLPAQHLQDSACFARLVACFVPTRGINSAASCKAVCNRQAHRWTGFVTPGE